MKREWSEPKIEILNVSMTMKGWKPPKPPKEPDEPETPDPTNPFDS